MSRAPVILLLIVLLVVPLFRPLQRREEVERSRSSTLTSLATDIVAGLKGSGLNRAGTGSFARIVIEKPYGQDLASALLAAARLRPEDCRRAAEARFSARAMIDRYFDVYAQLAAGRGLLCLANLAWLALASALPRAASPRRRSRS